MAALKRSLARETPIGKRGDPAPPKRSRGTADRRQAALLLPPSGARKRAQAAAAKTTDAAPGDAEKPEP
jgi:hypothetical protein